MEESIRYAYRRELNERVMSFVEDHELKVDKLIRPLPPKVLVFVLPKEHRYSEHIILPDQRQNKPVYEGVVVRTFKPYWKHFRSTVQDFGGSDYAAVEVKPSVEVGDHVLFQHFVGAPVPFMDYDMHKFRLIDDHEFFGVLEYPANLRDQVAESIMKIPFDKAEDYAQELARRLMDEFVIVLRDTWSKTTSGVGEYSGQ